jgi:hypothetical protein
MKDIETGEEIVLENYVVLVDQDGEVVTMNHYTFMEHVEKNKEYNNNYLDDASLDQFYRDYFPCTYEVRDSDGNILETQDDDGEKTLHQYPFYIPKDGVGFKKTLEHFLNAEKIKLN